MKLVKNRPFEATVSVHLPPPPNGQAETVKFTAHFVALSKAELKEYDMRDDAQVEAFLRRVLVGWTGIVDDSDGPARPLPFRPDTVDLLINDLVVTRGLLQAYVDTMAGLSRGN